MQDIIIGDYNVLKMLLIFNFLQKTLAICKVLCYNLSATVKVAKYITHIMSYAGRGVTADTRLIPGA